MIGKMKTIDDVKKVFVELVACGRGSMHDGPRAAIASIASTSISRDLWNCFTGGTSEYQSLLVNVISGSLFTAWETEGSFYPNRY